MAIEEFLLRRFEQPDEVREFPLGRFELVEIGGMTLGRATYEPGWKWSEHVGSAPDERCKVEHLGLVVSGRRPRLGPDYEGVMDPGDIFAVPPDHDSWVGRRRALRLAALPRRLGLRRRVSAVCLTSAAGKLGRMPGKLKTEAVVLRSHPLRRGRSDPAPLQRHARADRRDRQGGAQAALALRRAAGAVLPARPRPPRGARRAADGDRGAHDRRAPESARRRPGAGRGGARLRRGPAAVRLRGAESRPPTTCSAAISSILDGSESLDGDGSADGAAGLSTALAFRLKLALATGFAPELASCARCGEADELVGFSGARRRGRLRRLRARRLPALGRGARVHGRGARPAARADARRGRPRPAPGRAGDHRDAGASRARPAPRRGLSGDSRRRRRHRSLCAEHASRPASWPGLGSRRSGQIARVWRDPQGSSDRDRGATARRPRGPARGARRPPGDRRLEPAGARVRGRLHGRRQRARRSRSGSRSASAR